MLRRIRGELGITIIWVEHIHGRADAVVDRVMCWTMARKLPRPAWRSRRDPRVIEVYLGTDAIEVQAMTAARTGA